MIEYIIYTMPYMFNNDYTLIQQFFVVLEHVFRHGLKRK